MDHVENPVFRLAGADLLHIVHLDDLPIAHVADEFFQLPVNVSHGIPGLFQKQLHGGLGQFLAILLQHCQHPAGQHFLIRRLKFHHPPDILQRFVRLASLVNLFFYKNHAGGLRHIRQIFRQLGRCIFEKAGILHQNHPMLSKKGHGLRQIDEGGHLGLLPLKSGKIHGVTLRHQRPEQLVLIL